MKPLRLLALAGSLRRQSTNRALLDAGRLLAPAWIVVEVFDGLAELPHFDPDLEEPPQPLPPAVLAFRAAVASCDGLLIACPEYAHGIPGSFKNALDWLVGGPEFPGKPIALWHATARGTHARAALREVLVTMSGVLVDAAAVTVPLLGTATNAAAIVGDPDQAAAIRAGLAAFATAIRRGGEVAASA